VRSCQLAARPGLVLVSILHTRTLCCAVGVPGKKIAVFGLLGGECVLLIHLRAAGRLLLPCLSPLHRAHVVSTCGRIRETRAQGLDIATECVLLLFVVHARGLLMPGGAAEVTSVGVEADGAWGKHDVPKPRPMPCFSENGSFDGAVHTERPTF
jgi:hypothetical protein